ARNERLPIIEDCCHVYGSLYRGRPLGSFGAAAFYSFHWSKPIPGGRGGLAIVNDPAIEARAAQFHASCSKPAWPDAFLLSSQYLAFKLLRYTRLITAARTLLRWWSPHGIATGQFRRAELEYKLTADYVKTMVAPAKYAVKATLRREMSHIEWRQYLSAQIYAHASQLGISSIEHDALSIVTFMSYPLRTNHRERVSAEARTHHVEITPGFVSPVDPLSPSEWADVGYQAGSCPMAEYLAEKTITVPLHSFAGERHLRKLLEFLEAIKAQGLVEIVGSR
ncbi:MAG: DegT/DnrJ/EryC1/StrS family aminotransferase, partial [Deltaproteobacteria bacterium]|nr:DegT/DnrJ/EryC1/StrS family aminotransferase [Deltaproteobacteria bacterium]